MGYIKLRGGRSFNGRKKSNPFNMNQLLEREIDSYVSAIRHCVVAFDLTFQVLILMVQL